MRLKFKLDDRYRCKMDEQLQPYQNAWEDEQRMKSNSVKIVLTDEARAEVEKLEKITGLDAPAIFRQALSLYRNHVITQSAAPMSETNEEKHG